MGENEYKINPIDPEKPIIQWVDDGNPGQNCTFALDGKIIRANQSCQEIWDPHNRRFDGELNFFSSMMEIEKPLIIQNLSLLNVHQPHLLALTSFFTPDRRLHLVQWRIRANFDDTGMPLDFNATGVESNFAGYDQNTGVFSQDYLSKIKSDLSNNPNQIFSVIYIDINGVKSANDKSVDGHAEGDKLIFYTAQILKKSCRPEDMIFRAGGDEFIVLMWSDSPKLIRTVERRIADQRKNFNQANLGLPHINFALGFSTSAQGSVDTVISRADYRMFRHKRYQKYINPKLNR